MVLSGRGLLAVMSCPVGPESSANPRRRQGTAGRLSAASVERHALQGRELETLEAAHVHGRGGSSGRADAGPERRATAVGTEVMLDDVLVERVGRQAALGREQPQLLP